jgi:chitinase
MKVSSKFQVLATYLLYFSQKVSGHGYLKSPRSRNWVAKQDGTWYGGGATDPEIESCPHCLNRNSNTCGKTGSNDYDYPSNALGGPMPNNIQATYNQGEEIDFEAVLTAHHKGHFTYKACPIQGDELPTQACFDSNPLIFVQDNLYGAPPDPNYPDRAYIPLAGHPDYRKDAAGSYFHSHRYRLPANLAGDFFLIQWHYITGNSCVAQGYDSYQFPPNFYPGNLSTCSYPLPADGNGAPEQFWNCAEIKINSSGPTSPVVPPTKTPTVPPTLAPVSPSKNPTPPVNSPVSSPVNPPSSGSDSRMVAYLGNWQACPTAEQLEHYTDIMIAFAVTYTWNRNKNVCDTQCTIGSPVPICNNQNNQALVYSWRAAGKKVILSFGGAGMGGSWAGDVNDCWEYCYGKEESVINQLTAIVDNQNFDGVDIDFEYFYDTQPAQNFLRTVTTGLRSALPVGSLVTHAPMDPDLLPSTEYYQILKDVSSSIDFIMPQYYNGYTRPAIDGIDGTGSGSISALSHYTTLVDDMFNGDATKVLFSFCINDCSGTGSNANKNQAATVMSDLKNYFPCNGGAMFWVVNDDIGGSWSELVSQEIFPYSGCSDQSPVPQPITQPVSPPVKQPVPQPVKQPTMAPVQQPVSQPVKQPTMAPVQQPVKQPTMAPSPGQELSCPSGYSGLYPSPGCAGFFHCSGGAVISTQIKCPQGLLFNFVRQYCDWDYNVNCSE